MNASSGVKGGLCCACTKVYVSIFLPLPVYVKCGMDCLSFHWFCVRPEECSFDFPHCESLTGHELTDPKVSSWLFFFFDTLRNLFSGLSQNIIPSVRERHGWVGRPPQPRLNSFLASQQQRAVNITCMLPLPVNLLWAITINHRHSFCLLLYVHVFPRSSTLQTRESTSILGCSGEGNARRCPETPSAKVPGQERHPVPRWWYVMLPIRNLFQQT